MLNIDEMKEKIEDMVLEKDVPFEEIKELCERNKITLVDYDDTFYDSGYDGVTRIVSFVIRDEEGNIRCSLNNTLYLG